MNLPGETRVAFAEQFGLHWSVQVKSQRLAYFAVAKYTPGSVVKTSHKIFSLFHSEKLRTLAKPYAINFSMLKILDTIVSVICLP